MRSTKSSRSDLMSEQDTEKDHHHPRPLSDPALRAKAIEALLVEKGLLASDAIDKVVEIRSDERTGYRKGSSPSASTLGPGLAREGDRSATGGKRAARQRCDRQSRRDPI